MFTVFDATAPRIAATIPPKTIQNTMLSIG